jgi:hypothetical protein
MTENEIINDLECCKRNECARCNIGKVDGCRVKLLYAAVNLIKLQKKGRDEAEEDLERLRKENAELKKMVTVKYKEPELVDRVNDIMAALQVDDDEFDLLELVTRVGQFMSLLTGKWLITIDTAGDIKLIEK